jgi:pimeloyl-ACP methyl ester carboxylesterase
MNKTRIALLSFTLFFSPLFSSASILFAGIPGADWAESNASVFWASNSGTAKYASITFPYTNNGTIYVRAYDITNNWQLTFFGSAPVSLSESSSAIPFVLTSESDIIATHYFFVLTCYDPTFVTCNIFGNNSGSAPQYIAGGTGGWETSLFTGHISGDDISFINSTETEDDGINDAKGVADKTNFTFSVTVTGNPEVKFIVDGKETIFPRTTLGEYATTSTFAKGMHTWHFETIDGAVKTEEKTFTTGYSNVAFLPGIKASRLFKQKPSGCLTNCEDQLWEPNTNSDTLDIVMNPDGSSANENIYTKTKTDGVIDEGLDLTLNIYKSFLSDMEDWKTDGVMNDYGILAYDWRLAFPKILSGGKEIDGKVYFDDAYATDTPYLLQEIRELAESSATGKVTIVAHSMGGLLAKKILHDYQDIASSTDTLIMVDTPQLGTPQAIATLLHGTNEELDIPAIGWPNFTIGETVRSVAVNMPSTYTLLPSRDYTTRVKDEGEDHTDLLMLDASLNNLTTDPLFSGLNILNYYQTNYGTTTISTYQALSDFVVGRDGHSSQIPDNDLQHPKRIQGDMMAEAQAIHDEIDNWVPPEKMRVVQIAGWGMPETIRAINYKKKETCVLGICVNPRFDAEPVFTYDGDGTVVLPSQIAMTTETYFVDLHSHNAGITINRDHGSIFEVADVRTLAKNIVENKINPAQTLTFIKTNKNQLQKGDLGDLIRLSLHSPVKVDVYDKDGNHLGLVGNTTERQIINSYYLEFGEGKYIGFPLETGAIINLQGTGAGTFTLNFEQYQGDTQEGTQTFTDIPVTATTKAIILLNTLNDAKELALDQNGDGTIDSVIFTDENKETITFATLKSELQKLSNVSPSFLNQVETAEKQFNKENYKATNTLLLILQKEITKLSPTKISNSEALRLSAIIEVLVKTSK